MVEMAAKRIAKEWEKLAASGFLEKHLGNLTITQDTDDVYTWHVAYAFPPTYIVGESSRPSPYADHLYRFDIKFPKEYPFKAFKIEPVSADLYHPMGTCPPATMMHALKPIWAPSQTVLHLMEEYLILPFLDIGKAKSLMFDLHVGTPFPDIPLDALADPTDGGITVHVRGLTGVTYSVACFEHESIAVLKRRVEVAVGVPGKQQRLIFRDKQLRDDATVASCGIEHGATIVLVLWTRCTGMCFTNEDAIKIFEKDIEEFERRVRKSL